MSKDVQQQLENKKNDRFLGVPLLADTSFPSSEIFAYPSGMSIDFSIGQSNSYGQALADIAGANFSPSQIDINKTSVVFSNDIFQVSSSNGRFLEESLPQVGSSEDGLVQVALVKVDTVQDAILEVGSTQISVHEPGFIQVSSLETGTFHVGIVKENVCKVSTSEIGSNQNNSGQIQVVQPGSTPINPGEVSLSSFNKIFQPLSVHDPSPLLISNFYSTARSLWDSALSFNLNVKITDLPAGQLTEASLTGYDSSSRLHSGIFILDYHANCLGWFINNQADTNTH